jgi:3-oxoacyl-[acyl-carrier protein] reductase
VPASAASPATDSRSAAATPGRSVLVTGGNRGIGLAIVRAFAAAGDRVAATYRSGDAPSGEGVPEGVLWVRCDITDPASVEAAFSAVEGEHGPVEVLVANAGVTRDTLLLRMSEEDWAAVVETNLTGTFRVAKRAARGMLRQRRGRIVLIGSVVGLLGSAGQVNYAATKAGLVGVARSLARELGSRGITTNVVAPGFVETDMTAELPEETAARYREQIPLGRFAAADEIAAVVQWLASPQAAYVTGAVVPVDGGLGMGH